MFFVGLIDGLDDDGWKQIRGIPDTLKLTASLSLKINGLEDESFPSRKITSGGCHVSFRECSSGLLVAGHPGGRDRSEW